MISCPACTASMERTAKPHCESPACIWLTCTKCKCVIDIKAEAYFRGGTLWGNRNGYIRSVQQD